MENQPRNPAPKFCSQCGNVISYGAKFCAFCSSMVESVQQYAAPTRESPTIFSTFNSNNSKRVGLLLGIGIFFIPYIFAWFTLQKGYSTQARAISLGWAGFIIMFYVITIATNPGWTTNPDLSSRSNSITNAESEEDMARKAAQEAANAAVEAARAAANEVSSIGNAADRSTTSKPSCSDTENELASVKSDLAAVERMLNETEDYSEQGTIKKTLYMNALKRKGELQLQRITLERKLKACRASIRKTEGATDLIRDRRPSTYGRTAYVPQPETNIRESPTTSSRILCKVTSISQRFSILESSGVRDNNGSWYLTDACGNQGYIHSTQFRYLN